jgi:competence protein ComEC
MRKIGVLLAGLALAGCEPLGAPSVDQVEADGKDDNAVGSALSWRRATNVASIPKAKPKSGQYRVHNIDLGTGLGILVQGSDFTMLYDGGSVDDRAGIGHVGKRVVNGNRLLAYLFAALGPSGDVDCTPDSDGWQREELPRIKIDHLFLSHPHEDHDSLLADVLRCYDVRNVWDSGDDNDREGYSRFMVAVAAQSGIRYHNAAGRQGGDTISVFGQSVTLPGDTHAMAEGDTVTLGHGASLKLLHVDGSQTTDENLNSTVVRVQLGQTALLLAGDAEGGARLPPTANAGQIEGDLLARHADELKADIFQVGHHGSSTSSRLDFLEKVQPSIALLGVGPLPYAGIVLPEAPVIDAIAGLASKPVLLRTDQSDKQLGACGDRIGRDDDRPGGCDNFIITVKK